MANPFWAIIFHSLKWMQKHLYIWVNYFNKYVKRPNIYWRRHVSETISTSHTNMLLQKQYREKCFKKYYELISCLLVYKQKKMNYSLKWMQYQRIIIVVGLNVVNVVIIIDPTTTKMQVTTRSGRITKILTLKMSLF